MHHRQSVKLDEPANVLVTSHLLGRCVMRMRNRMLLGASGRFGTPLP
jgi:hypothetical protein